MRVYVAGASAEKELCAGYMRRLRDEGIGVTFDWTGGTVGDDALLTPRERAVAAANDLEGVRNADWFWLIVPAKENPSRGCWFESGVAHGMDVPMIASGDVSCSIFLSAFILRETHEEGFEFLVEQRKAWNLRPPRGDGVASFCK